MDPCPFIRLTVVNLALSLPLPTKPARNLIHPTTSPCFCKIKLNGFPHQTAVIPYITPTLSHQKLTPLQRFFTSVKPTYLNSLNDVVLHFWKFAFLLGAWGASAG
ncbi:hypothetical protein RND81_03G040400 [Saponaria officinalis]|uniref:Uncharacterized protein n=1 Tax=Saponaria officinalis TaxID=3572 RepID=A0AAW1M4C8_SAPOF